MRSHQQAPPAELKVSYKPTGSIYLSVPDSLEYWLTERYSLYGALEPGRVVYGEITHAPWPLQPAEAEVDVNTMVKALGIELPDENPICHFARDQQVVAWPITAMQAT